MKVASLRAIALVAFAFGAAPVAADDASTKSAAMSHGWGFSEQGAVGAGAYPSLVADAQLASADFITSVLLGGLKAMPPVGDMMSDAQVADVVNYVRTHFGNSYSDAVSAAAVSAARRRTASVP
jgi:mono/diheme cytochrome c family protein